MSKSSTVNSVLRAIDVLKCLGDGANKLSEISKRLGLSTSAVHRLLKTLEISGMIAQDPRNKRYSLGNLFINLAAPILLSHQRLIMCALDGMKHLRDFSGETVIIYTRIGTRIVCLEELPSEQGIKYTVGKRNTVPLYIGSAARVLLSELNDNEIEKLIKNIDFVPFTPDTITDKAVFMESIREVRKLGYASSRGTYVRGTAGISVPIKNYISPIALSILGPENRFGLKMMDALEELKETANQISLKILAGC